MGKLILFFSVAWLQVSAEDKRFGFEQGFGP